MSEFFDQLHEFSARYVKEELKMDSPISPWGSGSFQEGAPKGAIVHFTADEDIVRVLRWFLQEKYQSKSSSHVVVADRRLGNHDVHAADLPLIQALPATVVQCRLATSVSWHATWTNNKCYGIENVCAGELRKDETGSFTSWRPRDQSSDPWTMPWNVPYKTPVKLCGRFWSPYTPAQVAANVAVLRELQKMFPGSLKRSWILGHEAVQGHRTKGGHGYDKRDPSPTFPIEGLRDSLNDEAPVDTHNWFKHFSGDPFYGQTVCDGLVIGWVKEKTREVLHRDPTPGVAWKRFESAVRLLPEEFDADTFATGISILGYAGASKSSIEIFQQMMGLKVDADPGPITCGALIERLEDRGYLGLYTAV